MSTQHHTPDKDAIALLPPFERLGLDRITLVTTGQQAQSAWDALMQSSAWGFDTESKPTFKVGEVSDGPHVLQLATADAGWVIQLHDPACRKIAAELLAMPGIVKAGFGLGDDRKRIMQKLGVDIVDMLELNTVFRERRGARQHVRERRAMVSHRLPLRRAEPGRDTPGIRCTRAPSHGALRRGR